MPGSVRENDADVIDLVKSLKIDTVLDVGAGQGTYSRLLHSEVKTIDALEIWEPYIAQFKLDELYDNVYQFDARLAPEWMFEVDLVVFGDVLEHMSESEAVELWAKAGRNAKYGLISVPIIHYPQGAEFGNPYEVHVQEHLHEGKVRDLFGPFDHVFIYEVTGTFVRRFDGQDG